ncbi:MAG: NUDIX hydrolase [Aureliella sp.]
MADQHDGKGSRIHSREVLFRSSRFYVERRVQQLPSGELHQRDVIQHPGAVVILPIFDDGRICFIQNYRIAIDQVLLELPAGTRETDEPAIETARRELVEETGYECDSIQPLAEFNMSPGILNERMYAFVAKGLRAGQQQLEVGEQIETVLMKPAEVDVLLARNGIQDSKTLTTLLLYRHQAREIA